MSLTCPLLQVQNTKKYVHMVHICFADTLHLSNLYIEFTLPLHYYNYIDLKLMEIKVGINVYDFLRQKK